MELPPRQVLEPVNRQHLVGIDVKALNQAQRALKPPHASGSAKYMKENDRDQDKVCEIHLNQSKLVLLVYFLVHILKRGAQARDIWVCMRGSLDEKCLVFFTGMTYIYFR